MSYTPTEWESTDVVTATRMNALETAVGDMNMSYTPNTWSDGDILSAEKMNALEQAVASGGGGSSDFSTAQVTVTLNKSGSGLGGVQLKNFPYVYQNAVLFTNPAVSGTYAVPLYKGVAACSPSETGTATISNVAVSGNAQVSGQDIMITGDCTITIDYSVG